MAKSDPSSMQEGGWGVCDKHAGVVWKLEGRVWKVSGKYLGSARKVCRKLFRKWLGMRDLARTLCKITRKDVLRHFANKIRRSRTRVTSMGGLYDAATLHAPCHLQPFTFTCRLPGLTRPSRQGPGWPVAESGGRAAGAPGAPSPELTREVSSIACMRMCGVRCF